MQVICVRSYVSLYKMQAMYLGCHAIICKEIWHLTNSQLHTMYATDEAGQHTSGTITNQITSRTQLRCALPVMYSSYSIQ